MNEAKSEAWHHGRDDALDGSSPSPSALFKYGEDYAREYQEGYSSVLAPIVLDCTSPAWILGHEDGLADHNDAPWYKTANERFNYRDGWLTGHCERSDDEE